MDFSRHTIKNNLTAIKPKTMKSRKPILFVMGVSGSGKSTIGQLLAESLEISFFDADNYHPDENIAKMSKGLPLNDNDRQSWLERLNALAREKEKIGAVIACSALKAKYRGLLQKNTDNEPKFIYLKGSFEEVSQRLQQRRGHFMPPELLRSQFAALEVPEEAIAVSIMASPEEIVSTILRKLDE